MKLKHSYTKFLNLFLKMNKKIAYLLLKKDFQK
nr:MAG TPA: hypothetical protein [Caudoviricetes sp.]